MPPITLSKAAQEDAALLQAANKPVRVNVIQDVNELIKAKQRKLVECLYDDAAILVGNDLRLSREDILSIAGSGNPLFIEERMVGILSKVQGALCHIPGIFTVVSAKKKS